jgi:hypothetical protein
MGAHRGDGDEESIAGYFRHTSTALGPEAEIHTAGMKG